MRTRCDGCRSPRCAVSFPSCVDCGAAFCAHSARMVRCRACTAAKERADWSAASRRRKTGMVVVDKVRLDELARRDRWRCHLCGKPVDASLRYPDRGSASIDHIVPVSEGGEHSYRNTALAHLGCNVAKCALPMGEQLRLIG